MKTAILALVTLVATPAVAADRFDLVCSGTQEGTLPGVLGETQKPFSWEYRVDLSAMQYCTGECSALLPIFRVDAQNIQFEQGYANDPIYGSRGHFVSRVSGKYINYSFPNGRKPSISLKGSCDPAAFKGFPHPPTKF